MTTYFNTMTPERILLVAMEDIAKTNNVAAITALQIYKAATGERGDVKNVRSLITEDCAQALKNLCEALTYNATHRNGPDVDAHIKKAIASLITIQNNLVP